MSSGDALPGAKEDAREEISRIETKDVISRIEREMAQSLEKEQKLRAEWRERHTAFLEWETRVKAEIEAQMETQRRLQGERDELSAALRKHEEEQAARVAREKTTSKSSALFLRDFMAELSPSIERLLKKCKTEDSGKAKEPADASNREMERADTEDEEEATPTSKAKKIAYKRAVPYPEWRGEHKSTKLTFFYTPTDGLPFVHVYQTRGTDTLHSVRFDLRVPQRHLVLLLKQLGPPVYSPSGSSSKTNLKGPSLKTDPTNKGSSSSGSSKTNSSAFYALLSKTRMEDMLQDVKEEKGAYHEVAVALYPSQAKAEPPKLCALCNLSLQGEQYVGAGYNDPADRTSMCQKHRYCIACTGFMAHLANEDYGSFPCIGLGADPSKNRVSPCI